jgi:DNA-directed RNA polymerase subunit RPC12/RpoP
MFEDLVKDKPKDRKTSTGLTTTTPIKGVDIVCPYCSCKVLNKGVLVHYKQYWRQSTICNDCNKKFAILWFKDMTKAYIETEAIPTKP